MINYSLALGQIEQYKLLINIYSEQIKDFSKMALSEELVNECRAKELHMDPDEYEAYLGVHKTFNKVKEIMDRNKCYNNKPVSKLCPKMRIVTNKCSLEEPNNIPCKFPNTHDKPLNLPILKDEICKGCGNPITPSMKSVHPDDEPYHDQCYLDLKGLPIDNRPECSICGKPINHKSAIIVNGVYFHKQCTPEGDPDYTQMLNDITDDVMSYNVGDSNYARKKIQPWHIWEEYILNPWDADIIKRTLREKESQSRRMDYEKIIHICQKRISQIDNKVKMYGDYISDPVICDHCCFAFSSKFNFCPECGSKNNDE